MDKLLNYYQLLHVQPDAPAAVIKASYRAMMQKMRLHPDLGGDESFAQQLNEAVATLCHVERRLQYDEQIASTSTTARPSAPNATGGKTQTDADNAPSGDCRKPGSSRDPSASERTEDPHTSGRTEDRINRVQFPGRSQCPYCHAAYSSIKAGIAGYQQNNRCAQCKGARTPIDSIAMGSADDIRKIYRHAHQSDVWLYTDWPANSAISATMTDLSIAGCAINCSQPLPLQTVIMLDMQMLNGLCQVRYQKQLGPTDPYSVGLEFLTLDIVAGPGSVFCATA